MSRKLVEMGCNPRRKRILLKGRGACYHLISRAPFGAFFMESTRAKERFLSMMRRQARFCGIEILAFCLMSNHIHILVRVPFMSDEALADDVLLRRYEALYHREFVPLSSYSISEVEAIFSENGAKAVALRCALKKRMGNISVFMRELKQRFAFWYNAYFKNKGAVWSGRFRSQVVEDTPTALQAVAGYIDLNPVRAQMVDDPRDYSFSSLGCALSGNFDAQQGYCSIYHCQNWNAAIANYRSLLYAQEPRANRSESESSESIHSAEYLANPDDRHSPKFPLAELIHRHWRHCSEAGAIGSRDFVESIFESNRDLFGPRRSYGCRSIRGLKYEPDTDLFVLRDLTQKKN